MVSCGRATGNQNANPCPVAIPFNLMQPPGASFGQIAVGWRKARHYVVDFQTAFTDAPLGGAPLIVRAVREHVCGLRRRAANALHHVRSRTPDQATRAPPVVGLLSSKSSVDSERLLAQFHRGLAEHGYVDRRNVQAGR
jgi:hypothetical protein